MSTGGVLKYIILVNNKFFVNSYLSLFEMMGVCYINIVIDDGEANDLVFIQKRNFLCIIFYRIWYLNQRQTTDALLQVLIALTSQFASKLETVWIYIVLLHSSKSQTFRNMAGMKIGYCMNFRDEKLFMLECVPISQLSHLNFLMTQKSKFIEWISSL